MSAVDVGLIAVLVVAHLAVFAQAVLHTDLARDASVALMLLRDGQWPLLGPIMAGRLQLGPVWYYLLAVLLAPGAGVLGLQLGLGLLSALQYPLAYVCGRRLYSPAAGRLWAILLLLPAWSSFELIYPQHTSLTAPLLLGFGACALGYWRDQRPHQLVAAALLASLAVHAHPTAAGLLIPALLLVYGSFRRGHLGFPLALACGLAALLPFAPMLIALGNGQLDLLAALAGHYESGDGEVSLLPAPSLIWQALAGGGAYVLAELLGLGSTASAWWQAAWALLALSAAVGLWRRRSDRRALQAAAVIALAAVAMLLGTLLLRAFYPYYMTTALRVALLGALALGLSGLCDLSDWRNWRARAVLAAGLLAALIPSLMLAAGLQELHAGAGLRFAVLPLFEVRQAALPGVQLPLAPLRRLDRQAAAVCSLKGAALHGPWAMLDRNTYGFALRLHCPDTGLQGGGDGDGRRHVAALSGSMARALQAPVLGQASGLALFEVRAIARATAAWPAIAGPPLPYPPVLPTTSSESDQVLKIDDAGAGFLLVNRAGFLLDGHPDQRLSCAGQLRTALASDGIATLWSLQGCTEPRLLLRGADAAWLEVLLL